MKSSGASVASVDKLKVLLENVNHLEKDAFNNDCRLMKELMQHDGFQGRALGIILYQLIVNASFARESCWCNQTDQVFPLFIPITTVQSMGHTSVNTVNIIGKAVPLCNIMVLHTWR